MPGHAPQPPAPDDWRRTGQETYLRGVRLVRRAYTAPRPGWDHDHCEFCWATFSEHDGDLHEGWATGDAYRWVCDACHADFAAEFGWKRPDPGPGGA